MKKVLMVIACLVLVSGFASASAIYATRTAFAQAYPNGVGTISVTCAAPGTLPVGDTLTSVEVYYLADFQFGTHTGTNSIEIIATPSAAGVAFTPTFADCLVSGQGTSSVNNCAWNSSFNSPPFSPTFSTASVGMALLETENITFTGASTLTSGGVTTSSFTSIVEFDYTTPAPEPASLILIGSGLLGLGLVTKRRKKA